MDSSGGNNKPKVNLKPKRTAREWREHTNMKLRQYEVIASEYMCKSKKRGQGGYE